MKIDEAPGDGNCGWGSIMICINHDKGINLRINDSTIGKFRKYINYRFMQVMLDDDIVMHDSLDGMKNVFFTLSIDSYENWYNKDMEDKYHCPLNGLLEKKYWIDQETMMPVMSFILKKSIVAFNYNLFGKK